MSVAIVFEPEERLSSNENLNKFIEVCRDELTVFGADLSFDNNVWDLSSFIEQKSTKKRIVAIFSTYHFAYGKQAGKATEENIDPMSEPFSSFAKAYFRYRFGLKSFKQPGHLLEPLRILEQALININGKADPNTIDNYILDEAVIITQKDYSQARGYRIGGVLQNIGDFLSDKRLTKIAPDWKNPIKRPPDTTRVGKEADDLRNEKMPSEAGLEALPEIFNKATSPHELLTSSIIALLICAPNRINEVFLLPYDCEVVQKDTEGTEQYGLRWFPAKGAAPMIKWIIPSMSDIAKKAIRRLKKVTKQAREVCNWYDTNPKKVYLEPEVEYLRQKTTLNTREASYIIFGGDCKDNVLKNRPQKASIWINLHSVPYEKNGNKLIIKFTDLEKVILQLLPKRFPYINKELNLRFSNSLLVQMTNEYHSSKGTLVPIPEMINMGIVTDALKSRENIDSLFVRFGYSELDGRQIKMTSHQFRHYLNTLAQKGGLSQLDIAKWSGRIDIHQNKAYDHISANEMLEMVRESIGDENVMEGPLSNIEDIKKTVVISRDEFARLKVKTAHVTEIGVCIHDFTMTPCDHHRNCMGCMENLCMKGDRERNNRVRKMKNDTEALLEESKNAYIKGQFGANRWEEYNAWFLKILTSTCEILDDPSIPDGSLIQLSNLSAVSTIENANSRRSENSKTIQYDNENKTIDLNEIKNLLENMGEKNGTEA